jgi:hypothetical protein
MQERRRMPRYRLDTQIEVDGQAVRAIDISANSVYFESPRPFSPGTALSMVFPFQHTAPPASVNCAATVVRVQERDGGLFGVAVLYEPVAFTVSA